jgi:hypothetical protein
MLWCLPREPLLEPSFGPSSKLDGLEGRPVGPCPDVVSEMSWARADIEPDASQPEQKRREVT